MTVVSTATRGTAAAAALRSYGPAIAIVAVQQVFFPAPAGIVVRGLMVGGLTALIALGMALVYRANRIINFAQADLGLAPTMLASCCSTSRACRTRWPWSSAWPPRSLLGAATERVVIRRFCPLAAPARHHRDHRPQPGARGRRPAASRACGTVDLVAGRIAPPFDATREIGGDRLRRQRPARA